MGPRAFGSAQKTRFRGGPPPHPHPSRYAKPQTNPMPILGR
jgi:hypothetical protein